MAVLVRPGRPAHRSDESEPTALQQLSRDAVRYGASLGLVDRRRLAMRLYLFHRRPLTTAWRDRFPDSAAVMRAWGLAGPLDRALGERWAWSTGADPAFWWSWSSRSVPPASLAGKLYVSPTPDQLAPVLRRTVAALAAARSWVSLKVAADPSGLLRPDRLVCHLADPTDLLDAADRLTAELAGVPGHGVPFTLAPPRPAAARSSVVVSMAADPPAGPARTSWRWGASLRIADALIAAADRPVEDRMSAGFRALRRTEDVIGLQFADHVGPAVSPALSSKERHHV